MTDITAILNVHTEGLLSGPSIKSFEGAISHARERGLSVESIIVLDIPDRTTLAIFEPLQRNGFALIVSQCGDPGLARNMGVEAASGRYISFLDGDDLWGYQWLTRAYDFCSQSPIAIISHSEANVIFGEKREIWWHVDSLDLGFDFDYLRIRNYWNALSFAERAVYTEYPFRKVNLSTGFGHEDWHWNCVTFEAGIPHRAVPDTVHLVRRRSGSQMTLCDNSDAVPWPSELTSYSWQPRH